MTAMRELVEEGVISRHELELTVKRILKLKRVAFPGQEIFKDIEKVVKEMSIEQLCFQKLILPAWNSRHSITLFNHQVGGIAFEGVSEANSIRKLLNEKSRSNPKLIPPLFADNSPQETGRKIDGRDLKAEEIKIKKAFSKEVELQLSKDKYATGLPELLDKLSKEFWPWKRSFGFTP